MNDDLDMTDLQYRSFSNFVPNQKEIRNKIWKKLQVTNPIIWHLLLPSFNQTIIPLRPVLEKQPSIGDSAKSIFKAISSKKIEVAYNGGKSLQIVLNLRWITHYKFIKSTVCRVHRFSVLTFLQKCQRAGCIQARNGANALLA